MAAQAGLCLAWSETPEDTFCGVVAQMTTIPHNRQRKPGPDKDTEQQSFYKPKKPSEPVTEKTSPPPPPPTPVKEELPAEPVVKQGISISSYFNIISETGKVGI